MTSRHITADCEENASMKQAMHTFYTDMTNWHEVYHRSHNASVITCAFRFRFLLPRICIFIHIAWNRYFCSLGRNRNRKTGYY